MREKRPSVLRSIGISVDNVSTITTDNGSNMLATSNSIKIDLREFFVKPVSIKIITHVSSNIVETYIVKFNLKGKLKL